MCSHSINPQHNKIVLKCTRKTQLIAWVNIITQIAFALAGAFTPMMAGASSARHFLESTDSRAPMATKVYTLSSGESTESVAKKYNIPLSALRQLNQLRTFSHGFDHLQPGDELDVPYAQLLTITWDKQHSSAADASGMLNDDVENQKLAGMASQAGAFLSQSPNGDAAASMARGMASGAASSEIQQWLSRFGTARVQLDTNKHFSLKNSQFDLLAPLYEQKDSLVFTQASLHRTDDRTQSNLGMGYRWFTDTWMLGGNTFLDYGLSRDHARMGLGLEYWRDFLKLGVNGYQRLTNWKNSPDVTDYEERPANGWDVRAQAWLPVLPQLGGKLTYEQYYGQEVGLFGKDNRQRDPHAITAGVSYTPVPLVTFGAEQRQGQSGKNDTRLMVDMNYQLGVPWRSQVDPAAVAAIRSLAGSRYGLVDRNNNIVLEYRKMEVIRLKTADLVTGYTGEQKSLGVSVNSKYGLARIEWDAQALSAAGGKIVQDGANYAVVLPAYLTGSQAMNTYTVSGVAVDTKGNRSDRSDTQVTVQATEVTITATTPDEAKSAIKTDKATYVSGADMAVTVTLKDSSDNAVIGAASSLTTETVTVQNAMLKSGSSWKDNGDGTYTTTWTATMEGTGLKATVKLSAWGTAASSEAYAIIPVELKDVAVNGYTFAKDAGFPTTGFRGATFTLELSGGSASDFDWTSDAPSWVSVSAGVVSFTGDGTKDKVTITGVPKSGGTAITYSFTLGSWFINNGSTKLNWSDAAAYCTAQSGYSLATVQQLNGSGGDDSDLGTLGGLWSEWGNILQYNGAGFSDYYWSSEQQFSGVHYLVDLTDGNSGNMSDNSKYLVVCRQGL